MKDDYAFEELEGGKPRTVRLSELFTPSKDTLFLYSFMYGPKAKQPCPMCTSFLDGLDAQAPHHIGQRIAVAVAAASPIARIVEFARGRWWKNLRLVSAHDNSCQTDYFGEDAQGNQWPMANVFVNKPDGVHHFWGSEVLYADTKGETRHIDMLWPLWNVLDLTPGAGATISIRSCRTADRRDRYRRRQSLASCQVPPAQLSSTWPLSQSALG